MFATAVVYGLEEVLVVFPGPLNVPYSHLFAVLRPQSRVVWSELPRRGYDHLSTRCGGDLDGL